MWPFKKKEIVEQETERKKEQIEAIKDFRDIGEKFKYLGVEIIVTHHYSRSYHPYKGIIITPELSGDYVTANGELKKVCFSFSELGTLKSENYTR